LPDTASPAAFKSADAASKPEQETTKSNSDVETSIIPPQNIDIFANAFEKVFFNEDRQMRVGVSSTDSGQSNRKPIVTLRALRMGRKPNAGFYYEIQNQASFYAPRPISDLPATATIPISRYSTGNSFPGETVPVIFTDVDLNQWANAALAAIDAFLSTSDEACGSPLCMSPEAGDYAAKIRQHKQAIAGAIVKTLIPIFDTGASDEISLSAAQEKLYQSLLESLSNAFISSAVTVFSVANVSVDSPKSEKISPSRFYGQVQKFDAPLSKIEPVDLAAEETEQNYSLTTGKIQYFKSEDGESGDWRLPFLFSSASVRQQNFLPIPLAFLLTHLECNITGLPEISDKEQSTWIKLVNAPFVSPIGEDAVEFPVILRALPAPPNLSAQTADSNVESIDAAAAGFSPSELALWNYSFKYSYHDSAQDCAAITVAFNRQNSPMSSAAAEEHPMFAALARFVAVYNEILTDFETSLKKINDSSQPDETDVTNAKAASDAFEQIAGAVAAAYNQWVNQPPGKLASDLRPPAAYSFDIVLASDAGGKARIDVINPKTSEPLQKLPPPLVQFESYTSQPAADKPAHALVSYNYISSQSSPPMNEEAERAAYLSYADALNITERTIVLEGLNAFTIQNAAGQIQVIRNGNAGTNETALINDSFKFLSPRASFNGSLMPSLAYSDFDLTALPVSRPTLENYLDAFLTSLLKDAAGVSVWIKMTVSFSRALLPPLPDSPRAILPVAILPPEEIILQNGVPLPAISRLAQLITDWTRTNNPVLDSSSEYNIRLEVFGDAFDEQAVQAPLLSIDNLLLKTEKILFE
jgi:hypothetical protein